jgi:hypothetical protein
MNIHFIHLHAFIDMKQCMINTWYIDRSENAVPGIKQLIAKKHVLKNRWKACLEVRPKYGILLN